MINPAHKEPNWDRWADDIRLMREQDKRTHREICELFRWANQDSFWRTNILSPGKLREKWDRLVVKRNNQPAQGSMKFDAADYIANRNRSTPHEPPGHDPRIIDGEAFRLD